MRPLPHLEIAIGHHRLLLSAESVREIWTGEADDGAEAQMVIWRGVRAPVLNGRAMLGLPPADGPGRAFVAHEHGERILVLMADAVLGLRRIEPADLRPLPGLPRSTAALVDAAWLGQDGQLRLRLREDGLAPEKELPNAR